MNFNDLTLDTTILKAIDQVGYTTPTPIQEKAIPHVLEGRDLIGCAQTGTGKTAAFAIPILQLLKEGTQSQRKNRKIRCLILTPTRELALQIQENFLDYGRYLPLKTAVIFGGVSQVPQVESLRRGIDILVATPGRLNDLINQGHINLGQLEIFVLDEADRMLDMGFIHDVKKVLKELPKKRQTLLFSATMPEEIANLANSMLTKAVTVEVAPMSSTARAIEQQLYRVDKGNKRHLLAHLLKNKELNPVLVFTRTKHGADRVVRELLKERVVAQAIHGDKSQTARQNALSRFKNGETRVLVATDIAARGIDISELPYVINYDLPDIPETYVHRIGRTGRAGLSGIAISFCNFDESGNLKDIEKLLGEKIPLVREHPFPMVDLSPTVKVVQQRPSKPRSNTPVRGRRPR